MGGAKDDPPSSTKLSLFSYTYHDFSTVPELRSRYSKLDRYTKLRRQVKQARTANKNGRCSGAAHNGFSNTIKKYGQDF